MFIWDFAAIIAISVSLCLALVIGLWLFYTFKKPFSVGNGFKDAAFIKRCPICAYVFLDYLMRKGGRCPRCLSYLDDAKEQD